MKSGQGFNKDTKRSSKEWLKTQTQDHIKILTSDILTLIDG